MKIDFKKLDNIKFSKDDLSKVKELKKELEEIDFIKEFEELEELSRKIDF